MHVLHERLFLEENDKGISIEIKSKIDEGLDILNYVFKIPFNQIIAHNYCFLEACIYNLMYFMFACVCNC